MTFGINTGPPTAKPYSLRFTMFVLPEVSKNGRAFSTLFRKNSNTSPCSSFVPPFVMYRTCALELRPYSALKLLVITFTSLIELKFSGLSVPPVPVTETSVAVMPSTVMLLPRPRPPFELKLPEPRNGLFADTGATPGAVSANRFGFRATGISCTASPATDVCNCAFSVFSSETASVTLMVSVTWPTSRLNRTLAISPVLTSATVVAARKPAASARTSYRPIFSSAKLNVPSVVSTLRVSPVSELFKVTVALGTIAPLLSSTVPLRSPVICA